MGGDLPFKRHARRYSTTPKGLFKVPIGNVEDSRWQLGQGIRNPKLHDSRNLEMTQLHLGNSDCF
jgi:hypothetical protein